MSGGMGTWKLAAVLAITSIIGGCGSFDPATDPPCASVRVRDAVDRGGAYRGQGILAGSRFLSAGHIFVQNDAAFPPGEIIVEGRAHTVSASIHGDMAVVRRLYGPGRSRHLNELLEDWVCFEWEADAEARPIEWDVGDGTVRASDSLYAVRADVLNGSREFESMALTVLAVDADEPVPSGVVFVRTPPRVRLAGWSGSFVGRYHPESLRWEFVGIFIASKDADDSSKYAIVLRPPENAIRWLRRE